MVSIIEIQLNDNIDLTWDLVPMFAWAVSEGPILILGICLPSMNFLYQRVRRYGFASLFSRKLGIETHDTTTTQRGKSIQTASSSGEEMVTTNTP